MQLKQPIANLLAQLHYVLGGLSGGEYMQPVKVLSQSTIGQHTRHILEFFIELDKGYAGGLVDYDKRTRNRAIETDKYVAIETLQQIEAGLGKQDKDLLLNVEYGADSASLQVFTNYYRELVYNLEHMVHHMALIRIGVEAISVIEIPAGFGVAASTLKFRNACAQ
jgi:hypothetical protein